MIPDPTPATTEKAEKAKKQKKMKKNRFDFMMESIKDNQMLMHTV